MTARANLRMKPEDPGPLKDKKVKEELKAQYSAIIDDGIANLQKALDIDKEYDDAMAYMNLLIRERADLPDYAGGLQEADRNRRYVGAEGARHQEAEAVPPAHQPGHHGRAGEVRTRSQKSEARSQNLERFWLLIHFQRTLHWN